MKPRKTSLKNYLIILSCIIFLGILIWIYFSQKYSNAPIVAKANSNLHWITKSDSLLNKRCKYKVYGWDKRNILYITNSCNLYNLYEYVVKASNAQFGISHNPSDAEELEGQCFNINLNNYIEHNPKVISASDIKNILENKFVEANLSLQGKDKNVVFSPDCKLAAIRIHHSKLPSEIFLIELK